MERNKLKRILIVTIGILIISMVLMVIVKFHQENKLMQKIKVLPTFAFKSTNNHLITPDSISSDKKTIIVFYSSECFHCYNTFDQIVNIVPEISSVQILMVSSDSLKTINGFREKFDLDSGMPIKFYRCSEIELNKLFGPYDYPTLYCYDRKRNLIKKLSGNIDIDNLKKLINSGD